MSNDFCIKDSTIFSSVIIGSNSGTLLTTGKNNLIIGDNINVEGSLSNRLIIKLPNIDINIPMVEADAEQLTRLLNKIITNNIINSKPYIEDRPIINCCTQGK